MVVHVNGILRGDRVELDHRIPGLPDGSPVALELRSLELGVEEKREMVRRLCGAFAGDSSIGPIFQDIVENRRSTDSRPVSFDDPS